MTLAVVHTAGQQHNPARRVKADLGMLVVASAGRGAGGGHPDAEQPAAPPRRRAALGRPVIAGERQAVVEVLDEVPES